MSRSAGDERLDGKLGEQVRRLRHAKHMSLGDLAELVNTSRSFLSQVEQSKTLPSLTTLKSIAHALNVTVGSLIDEPLSDGQPVVRKDRRPSFDQIQSGIVIEALTWRDVHKSMEPIMLRIEPGAVSGRDGYAHRGQEFVYVLTGSLTISLDGVDYQLDEGDSIYFDSTRPHTFSNGGETDTEAIWVVNPPTM